MSSSDGNLLSVKDLRTYFATEDGTVRAVDGISFDLKRGETLGIVGESGSGKSVTNLSIIRLIPSPPGRIVSGEGLFHGQDILSLPAEEVRRIRGKRISMIFQDPMTSLNPFMRISRQLMEITQLHLGHTREQAYEHAVRMLETVGIPEARARVDSYPHEFSGGMRQRAMIAMALACEPQLLIADEPTTALDVTVQAQILDLLRSLQDDTGMGMLFVTHDLGVVADICDRVAVMYAGQIVETARTEQLFSRPRHPYADGLLASMPQRAAPGHRLPVIPGRVPAAGRMPSGCRFRNRCSWAEAACEEPVGLQTIGPERTVRCRRHDELVLGVVPDEAAGEESPRAVGAEPVLVVEGLRKEFPVTSGLFRRGRGRLTAVDG